MVNRLKRQTLSLPTEIAHMQCVSIVRKKDGAGNTLFPRTPVRIARAIHLAIGNTEKIYAYKEFRKGGMRKQPPFVFSVTILL